jgi:dihydroorotate dehydrogenase
MANPLIYLFKPEPAHQLALWALKHGLGPRRRLDHPALRTRLLGKDLVNPIGLSAGAEKRAEALPGWRAMGFGMVEAGTVTLKPRSGNPGPRVWRVPRHGVVNWLGLPGAGIGSFATQLRAFNQHKLRDELLLGASLASPDGDLGEFGELAERCAPWVDYLTLNASCPNVSHACESDPARTARRQVEAVVRRAQEKPVLLKLGPSSDSAAIRLMVEAAMEAGAKGIVATNTVPWDKRSLIGDVGFEWPTHDQQPVGGYSGPALLDIACFMVAECRDQLGPDVPIIGVGGVQSGQDAVRLMDAGANAIQLYTGLIYHGGSLLKEIANAIVQQRS